MLTVEPWDGPDTPRPLMWRGAVRQCRYRLFVRFMHEMNGSWGYPWQTDPSVFLDAWSAFYSQMPDDVNVVWCPNISYPGSRPMRDFYPFTQEPDWVALDGYARRGESMEDVFADSLRELRALAPGKPVMIAETGTERGRGQAKWWREGLAWAENAGVDAVVAFNENKSGRGIDERNWSLSPASWKAFLGGGR